MIDPKAVTTYAQYNEDLIILALLHSVKEGFYVDVGANYPVIDSVTKLFYDKGWRGINIEPLKSMYKLLADERPRDINLQIGVGDKSSKAMLREFTEIPGHSTFDAGQKKLHSSSLKHKDYQVPIKTLKEVLGKHAPKQIHFMKIDVEGLEYQVVAGNDWGKFRPQVICIETNHMSKDWRPIFYENKYKLFIADGLNEYYVALEHWQITVGFAERMIQLDYHALKQHQQQSWSEDSKMLTKLHQVVAAQHAEILRLENLASLSLKQQPLSERVKRASHGLTKDWVRFKKETKNKNSNNS